MGKLKILKPILFSVIFIGFLCACLPFYFLHASSNETKSSSSLGLDAVLYDTNQYGNGTGTALTEAGASVSGWQFNMSKFLQVDPMVPSDGNTYVVSIKLPKELYAVTNELVKPGGYSAVDFTKNSNLAVNGNSYSYGLNSYSGTFYYTMNVGAVSGTIQLELRYDNYLWDKKKNSTLTAPSVKPVEVSLSKKEADGSLKEISSVSISSATSGEALAPSNSHYYYVDGISYNSGFETAYNKVITSRMGLNSESYASYYFYYPKMKIIYQVPYYTDSSGVKHYANLSSTTPTLYNFKGKANYTVDTSLLASSGIVSYTFTDFYWQMGTMMALNLTFPSSINDASVTSFNFTGGSYKGVVTSDNGTSDVTLFDMATGGFIYKTDVSEKVTLSGAGRGVTLTERPNDAVSELGGFYLENRGTADSGSKTISMEFDKEGLGKIKVTTVNTFADRLQEYIPIEYSLVDDTGALVYLDASGNRVSEGTSGAISKWTYNMKNVYYNVTSGSSINNKFTRSMLPTSQKGYYFKTIKYTINSIKATERLYSYQSNSALGGAGNFFGYLASDIENNEYATSSIVVSSYNDEFAPLKSNAKTTANTISQPTYTISSVTMSKTRMVAGESVTVSGNINIPTYPYGNSTWLKSIRVGVLLPRGVSLNESSISASTKLNTSIKPVSVTNKEVDNGFALWTITFSNDISIGYATEGLGSLSNGADMKFNFQLDTDYSMSNVTLFARDMLSVAGLYQSNSAGGSYSWASKVDVYDMNENGSTTDRIAGMRATVNTNCEIVSKTALLDISDSVSLNGSASADVVLSSPSDIVTYNLDIKSLNGGYTEDFSYFIPIPKKASGRDSFLIESPVDSSFDMALTDEVSVTGTDIFDFKYAFDEGLSYSSVTDSSVVWYTASDINSNDALNWEDVTMVKLIVNGGLIVNGSVSRVSLNLKYAGTDYGADSGTSNVWHSAGYYHYVNNDRETTGNFATNGVSVSVSYRYQADDIVLTAAKDMTPQGSGNVNEFDLSSGLPKFKYAHSFKITDVSTYNVVLLSKSDILSNVDMPGIEANRSFGLTVSMGSNEVSVLDSANTTPISVGSSSAGSVPSFKFKLYNANALSDSTTQRYVVVTLTSDNGAVIKQKININRELALATEPHSAIVAGERYISFDDSSTSVKISNDSAFTAQFVTSLIPGLYGEHVVNFSDNLPSGTLVTLVNATEADKPTYWYYKASGNVSSISFADFIKMGTTDVKNYSYDTSSKEISEKLMFIVDFSNCTEDVKNTYNINMRIRGNGIPDVISEDLRVTTSASRTFDVSSASSVTDGSDVTVSYSSATPDGAESKYEGRKLSYVITSSDTLPIDSYVVMNDTRYYLNKNNEFILPLSSIGSGSFKIRFGSNLFPSDGKSYNLSGSLWASSTANALLPKMGEKLASNSFMLKTSKVLSPSLKVVLISDRLLEKSQLGNLITLKYDYLGDGDCDTTIELQQKIGNGYQTLTDKLSQVNGNTSHEMGVYSLNSAEGINTVTLKLASNTNAGTYRLLLKVKNGEKEIISIPYNLIIIADNS